MGRGINGLKRGVFLLVIGLVVDLHFPVCQNFSDSLNNLRQMLVQLDNLQEASNYKASIPLGMELIRQAEHLGGPDVGIITDQARMYLMEAYRELQMFSQLEGAARALQAGIEESNKKKAVTIAEIVSGYGRTLLYADFCFNIKDYKKASLLLRQAIQFVIEHKQFYRTEYLGNNDCRHHRLYQCYDRLGQIALDEQNYTQAKIYFVEGLHHARLADRAIRIAGRTEQGFEEKSLINLIKLTIKAKDTPLLDYYLDAYKIIPKSGAYAVNRDRDLLTTLLQQEDLAIDQGLQLISRLNANPLAVADLKTQFLIIDFYLRHQLSESSRDLINHLAPSLHHHNHKASWYLARAGLANTEKEYAVMSQYIDSSLFYFKQDVSEQDIWEDEGLRTQLLETVQKGIVYHNQAYETGLHPASLNKKIELIEQFILGLKAIRKDLISDEDRLLLVQQLTPLIDLSLKTYSDSLLLRAINYNTVLACFEAGKAFNLLSEFTLKTHLSDSEFKIYNNLRNEQKAIEQKYGLPGVDLDQLQKQTARVQAELVDFLSIHAPPMSIGFPAITEVQRNLDQNSSLVEFFKGDEFIYILVIHSTRVQLVRSPIVKTSFENDLKNVQYSVLAGNEPDRIHLRDSLFRTSAWNLYRTLLSPVDAGLKHRVILVPDHALAQIPFAALLDEPVFHSRYKQWPYWIHHHALSIQYSSSLWVDQLRKNPIRINKEFEFSFTAFAPQFNDLLFNMEECKEVSGLFGQTADYYGAEANRLNFKSHAGQGRILHIASHAQSNIESQDRSYIRMQEDTLYAGEIGLMNLPLDLVFLSACETGTGKMISGEGMMSLARSFFQSGARSVISTLWPVRDEISMEQVIRIYKNFKTGKRKDDAIREMQLNYLTKAGAGEAFPSFWAAFQCQGDLQPLFPHPLKFPAYVLGFSGILSFLIGVWRYVTFKGRVN